MRGTAELLLVRNVYCLAAVVVLASSLVGSASGSCLSYGHSCWGAHGKRSGNGLPPRLIPWLLTRHFNRQLMQVPLAARQRAAWILDEDRPIMDNFENVELNDLAKSDQKFIDDEPDNRLIAEQKDMSVNENDQAIKAGLYKILRNID